jgi:hypothetical protein
MPEEAFIMRRIACIALLATLIATPFCIKAQTVEAKDAAVPHGEHHDELVPVSERQYVHLSFNLNELDENGKVINTRHFDAMTYAHPQGHDGQGSIHVEDSVPVLDKEGHAVRNVSLCSDISFSHLYVIDQRHISLTVSANISDLLFPVVVPVADDAHPIIRSNHWRGMVLMPIGERKVVFSSDDLASKHVLQVELLVTRAN